MTRADLTEKIPRHQTREGLDLEICLRGDRQYRRCFWSARWSAR